VTIKSKYRAMLDEDCVRFINPRNRGEYGYLEVDQTPYQLPDGELVGTVNSLCDALPLIFDHTEKEYLERRQRELAHEKEAARFCLPFALSG